MAETREVKFYNGGVYYASITIVFSEDGKRSFIPSTGYALYQMDIEDVDAGLYELDPDLIVYGKIGDRRRRSYLVPVEESKLNPMMQDEWRERKEEERSRRCLITGKNGTPIVCANKSCYGCENACNREASRRVVSLDALQEKSHWDPAMEGKSADDPEMIVMAEMADKEFCDYLASIQAKLVPIFQMDRDGYSVKEICEELGIRCERTVYNDLKRIETYHEKFAAENA